MVVVTCTGLHGGLDGTGGDWTPNPHMPLPQKRGGSIMPYPPFHLGYPPAGFYESPMSAAEGEKEWLKRQAESIRQEIDRIKSRISELEQE